METKNLYLRMNSENDLGRFIKAQDFVYQQVIKELKNGKKTSHWMWYIFPQVAGLASSSIAQLYSIKSLKEAEEYLADPVLNSRLNECCNIILNLAGRTVNQIFGSPDNMKLLSSMTLFEHASTSKKPFSLVIEKYFNNERDAKTVDIIKTLAG